LHDSWGLIPIRVTDLAVTPDLTRLVTIGMDRNSSDLASTTRPGAVHVATSNGGEPHPGGTNPPAGAGAAAPTGSHANGGGDSNSTHKMIIYDLATKTSEL